MGSRLQAFCTGPREPAWGCRAESPGKAGLSRSRTGTDLESRLRKQWSLAKRSTTKERGWCYGLAKSKLSLKGLPCRELGQPCGAVKMVATSSGGPQEGGEVSKALL